MQFIKNLFRSKEDPCTNIEIEGVGRLSWDIDSEYWVGEFNAFKISVAYDGFSSPKEDLEEFVRQSLLNPQFLEDTLVKIKKLAKNKYSEKKHNEIESLQPQDIVFQSPSFILIQFFGPNDNEPFWFSEIHGNEIYVGYDT